jgi:hypothetical protein
MDWNLLDPPIRLDPPVTSEIDDDNMVTVYSGNTPRMYMNKADWEDLLAWIAEEEKQNKMG